MRALPANHRLTALLVMLIAPVVSNAQTRNLQLTANASGVCQGALPNFEGQIRKRPLALQNEGTETAFVTCSPTGLNEDVAVNLASSGSQRIQLVNRGPSTVTVSCTGVSGSDGSAGTVYITRSASLPAGTSVQLQWSVIVDFYSKVVPFNMSCALPPGVGISRVATSYLLGVG